MVLRRPFASLALLVLLAGCTTGTGSGGEATDSPSPPGSSASGEPGDEPRKGGFRVLEAGWNTYAETDGFEGRVLRDQASWEAFWAEHRSGSNEPGAAPAVDFGSEVAVAVLMGSRNSGGYAIEVTDVAEQDGGLVVRYATTSPGDSCGTGAVISHPYELIAAKGPADVVVEFELADDRVDEC